MIRKITFFLATLISFIPHQLRSQNPAFGGGLGVNALRSNGTYWVTKTRPQGAKEVFGNPHISLNIDYHLPKKINHKLIGKLYNPVFKNPYLQPRVQLIFNQFRIHNQKDNSVATVGGSLLIYPLKYSNSKKINYFVEMGYKGGWNNTIKDPFHATVLGAGGRMYMGNEWFLQANLSYSYAFNDALDKTGKQGFSFQVRDRYILFNVSLLKSFLTDEEKRKLDRSRDSLAMCKSFANNAAYRSKNMSTIAKPLLDQFAVLEQKVTDHKANAVMLTKLSNEAIRKATNALNTYKDSATLHILEGEIDQIDTKVGDLYIAYRVGLEKATTDLVDKNVPEREIKDLQAGGKEAREFLKSAYNYLPMNKELEFEIRKVKSQELGNASKNVLVSESDLKKVTDRIEESRYKIKDVFASFDTADKAVKDARETVERAKMLIDARKNQ